MFREQQDGQAARMEGGKGVARPYGASWAIVRTVAFALSALGDVGCFEQRRVT